MTDFEHADISRRLAIAIGWPKHKIYDEGDGSFCSINTSDMPPIKVWRDFDYRDPAVIWPIAERFDCFPAKFESTQTWACSISQWGISKDTETAALAVAINVIDAKKST
jgi:hypothetical protein